MARRHIVGGLDIGTTKVVSVLAEVSPNGYPIIKGLGECPTLGVRKGVVIDKASLSKSIAQAVRLSQAMAGEITNAFHVAFPVVNQLAEDPEIVDGQLAESIAMAGVEILEIIPSVVASGEAILTDTHKKIGTVLMDLGGAITGLAVFDQGLPVYTQALAVGSEHITSDLAVCLRTSIGEGERIKRNLGLAEPEPGCILEINSVGGHETRKVPASTARDIIQSRMQEIFELAQQEVSRHYRLASLTGGFMLTGGGALLKGVLDLAAAQMNCSKVAVGSPGKVGVPGEEWTSPVYASSIGLVLYGAKRNFRRLGRLSVWREVLDRFI